MLVANLEQLKKYYCSYQNKNKESNFLSPQTYCYANTGCLIKITISFAIFYECYYKAHMFEPLEKANREHYS